MILHRVQCEMCPHYFEIGAFQNAYDWEIPDGWYMLHQGKFHSANDRHFCSDDCLRSWLVNRAVEGEAQLTQEQKNALDKERRDLNDFCRATAELIEKEHPELKVSWGCTLHATPREGQL
jgi:hypothetical protein